MCHLQPTRYQSNATSSRRWKFAQNETATRKQFPAPPANCHTQFVGQLFNRRPSVVTFSAKSVFFQYVRRSKKHVLLQGILTFKKAFWTFAVSIHCSFFLSLTFSSRHFLRLQDLDLKFRGHLFQRKYNKSIQNCKQIHHVHDMRALYVSEEPITHFLRVICTVCSSLQIVILIPFHGLFGLDFKVQDTIVSKENTNKFYSGTFNIEKQIFHNVEHSMHASSINFVHRSITAICVDDRLKIPQKCSKMSKLLNQQ